MCKGCWETYGAPSIISYKTKYARRLIADVYDYSIAGGNLHIHLDDWNVDDIYFDKFVNHHPDMTSEDQLKAERTCFEYLKSMSVEERASALALYEGYL